MIDKIGTLRASTLSGGPHVFRGPQSKGAIPQEVQSKAASFDYAAKSMPLRSGCFPGLLRFRRTPPQVWLLGLIILGFAIRLGSIDFQSLWRDEVDAIRFGRDLSALLSNALAGGGIGRLIDQLRQTLTQPGFNGPLYFIALAQWAQVVGSTGFALRLFSTLFGILAIPLIYVLGKRLQRATHFASASHLSLLAAWLVTISPYFVWYSQEAKMYTEITALALMAIYALRRAVDAPPEQRTWPWWLLVVAATTLAMYSHIFAALLIGVEVALFLVWWPESRRHWQAAAIALAALTLPYLPLATWQIAQAFTPGSQGFTFYRFDEILRVMIAGFTNGILPFDYTLSTVGIRWDAGAIDPNLSPAYWGAWLLSVLVFVGALLWKDAPDRAGRIGLAAWTLLPAAAIAIISLNRPIFTDRYLIWIGPAVYLLAVLGIAELWKWHKVIGGTALAVVTCIALMSLYAQAITPFKADFRSAARYVEERYRNEAIVFQIPYGQYPFDYYFEPAFPIIEGPYTNHRNVDGSYQHDAASFDAVMSTLLSGHDVVWLVATEVEMWDDRYLLEDWLNRHARAVDRVDFTRVTVIRYELSP